MDTIARYLSSYGHSLRYEDIPEEALKRTKLLIVDTLGCAIGAYHSEPARIAREMAATVTSTQPATVLGSGGKTSPDLAAFANGVMVRYLDFNDGYTSLESGHPSDAIAAVLSPAEVSGAGGKTVITSVVLAYEAFCRLCDAVSVRSRRFDHVTLGVVAGGLGAAKAMGLTREQTEETVNLCVAPNVALYQTRIGDVSMWKGCAFANASRNAVFAAMMAQRGLTGPSPVFEGFGGFFNAVSRDPFSPEAFGGDGRPFKVMEATIKRFPLGLYSQTVVEAALEVRDRVSSVDDIAEVRVETLQTAIDIMAGDEEKWRPANRETADHSMPYSVAVALTYGNVEERHFGDEYLRDGSLLALTGKVKVAATEEANRRAPKAMLATVEVVTKSGERHRSSPVPYHRGHWKNPMTDREVEAKFRALSTDLLGPDRTDALLDRLWDLERVDRIGEVLEMARVTSP